MGSLGWFLARCSEILGSLDKLRTCGALPTPNSSKLEYVVRGTASVSAPRQRPEPLARPANGSGARGPVTLGSRTGHERSPAVVRRSFLPPPDTHGPRRAAGFLRLPTLAGICGPRSPSRALSPLCGCDPPHQRQQRPSGLPDHDLQADAIRGPNAADCSTEPVACLRSFKEPPSSTEKALRRRLTNDNHPQNLDTAFFRGFRRSPGLPQFTRNRVCRNAQQAQVSEDTLPSNPAGVES